MTKTEETKSEPSDIEDNKTGELIASVLKLRRDPFNKDRWQTKYGSKTNVGIAKTVRAILENRYQ